MPITDSLRLAVLGFARPAPFARCEPGNVCQQPERRPARLAGASGDYPALPRDLKQASPRVAVLPHDAGRGDEVVVHAIIIPRIKRFSSIIRADCRKSSGYKGLDEIKNLHKT